MSFKGPTGPVVARNCRAPTVASPDPYGAITGNKHQVGRIRNPLRFIKPSPIGAFALPPPHAAFARNEPPPTRLIGRLIVHGFEPTESALRAIQDHRLLPWPTHDQRSIAKGVQQGRGSRDFQFLAIQHLPGSMLKPVQESTSRNPDHTIVALHKTGHGVQPPQLAEVVHRDFA